MPLTLTILSAAVPKEKRGLALGAWGGISGLAIAFGPLVGGAVVEGLSWQWIFWLNVPIGLLLIPLALAPDGDLRRRVAARPARSRPGERGAVRHRLGARPRQRAGLDVARDRRRARRGPRLDRGVRRLGAARRGADAAAALLPRRGLLAGERGLAADVLRHVRLDLPAGAVLPDRAGLPPLGPGCGSCPGRWRRCSSRRSPARSPTRCRCAAARRRAVDAGCGARWIGLVSEPDTPYGQLVVPFISRAWAWRSSSRRSRTSSPRRCDRGGGSASGANNAIRELGGVFGVAVLAAVFARVGGYESGQAFVDGMNPAILIGAGVVGVGALAAFMIPTRRRAQEQPVEVEHFVPELELLRRRNPGVRSCNPTRCRNARLDPTAGRALACRPWACSTASGRGRTCPTASRSPRRGR